MTTVLLDTEQKASLGNITQLRHQLEQALERRALTSEQRNAMLLCLAEAGTNVVEHNADASHIRLQFGFNRRDWWLRLEDNGCGWNPDPHINTLPTTLQSHGRGLMLLQELSDRYQFQSATSECWNRLDLYWQRCTKPKKPTLLVVDDDISQRRVIEAYLAADYTVFTAGDGPSALRLLQQQDVDMVISDIRMPGMTGFDLRQQLAQILEIDTLPFIFVSAAGALDVRQQANALGIDDFLDKPISKSALISTINRVLERSQQVYSQLTERINQRISATLSPKLPDSLTHWRTAVASRNAGIGGGDLLLHKTSHQHSLLTLVDIMGHDEVSKFFSYAYSGYIRGLLHSHLPSQSKPDAFLQQLSDSAYADELLSQLTLTCAAIALAPNGAVDIACAGHPPPLLISNKGVMRMAVGGMLPGLMEHCQYQSEHFDITPGQRIACFTDGLFESAGDASSRQHLQCSIESALVSTCNMPLQQAADETMRVFDRLAGPTPTDDTLLLLIEPRPSDHHY
jgi:CheY-like chemotaxis protein/anti-sigma regulatory factor (Ser/Thr protein kinase)